MAALQESQISRGQEAVFRIGRTATWSLTKTSCRHPRLTCVLACPMILMTALLAITVTFFWKHSFDEGLMRQQTADDEIMTNFNASSTLVLTNMAHHLQAASAITVVQSISKFASWPKLVTQINANAAEELPAVLNSEALEEVLEDMWKQMTTLFPDVDFVYAADAQGSFVGYERLPWGFAKEHNAPSAFGGEFRPSDGVPLSSQICSLCPPMTELRPGQKTYYLVDQTGKFVSTYKRHDYDPRKRHWYERAAAARGHLVWIDIYNFSSGHSLGMTAAKAVVGLNGEVLAVAASDFTVSYLSRYMEEACAAVEQEEGFILDTKGLMVASSMGISQVAWETEGGQARYHWSELNVMVTDPLRTLLRAYGSLEQLPKNGTMTTDDGRLLFTYMDLTEPFQAQLRWIVIITTPVSTYMMSSWQQQAWAASRSQSTRQHLEEDLHRQEVKTLLTCAVFALVGALLMTCVGLVVTRPLKKISTEMLTMAKLEFLPSQLSKKPSERGSRKSTRLQSLSRGLMGRITRTFTGQTGEPLEHTGHGQYSDETSSSGSEDSEEEQQEVESCFQRGVPKEVVNMRESFGYMVTGLKSFARYMDPDIMHILVKSKKQAQLGMGRAEVTIFFSDIANFTTIAESLEPEAFMAMLSTYLDEMSKIIMSKRGVVGEFIGDAIMAWWNVPVHLGPEHTAMALSAALAQQRRLEELRAEWLEQGLPEVNTRMGLVKGVVLAGNIGSSQRMKYGLVGDSVNLASRLEGLCKFYGVSVIVENELASDSSVSGKFRLRLLDLVTVKGRSQPTELYELVAEDAELPGRFSSAEQLEYYLEGFRDIHRNYRNRKFQLCFQQLRQYQHAFPEDQPCQMLFQRVEALIGVQVDPNWSPVHVLKEK
ncbi:unnamed protein product [Effrenium voratum]|uniref:Guanylate cyclase domain-containing protein n=1 Tax=Effrenium voratum TaxID=2562239 RepID=A0AA36JDA0_9DINO|nr:unnamed protein product [Effrenium voratum]CAJ1414696.1 unnamed protein product [Effrenium voratum]